ncbi:hypothetical protein [Kordia sp.]|uniref:hypothetical protein n=1 Tax=Kordia sp. TaxID=1965332 RepID=UPI003D28CDA2
MKKKKLKALSLKKASISSLNGGEIALPNTTITIPIPVTRIAYQCYITWNVYQCTGTGPSELLTACDCLTRWENTCNFD